MEVPKPVNATEGGSAEFRCCALRVHVLAFFWIVNETPNNIILGARVEDFGSPDSSISCSRLHLDLSVNPNLNGSSVHCGIILTNGSRVQTDPVILNIQG